MKKAILSIGIVLISLCAGGRTFDRQIEIIKDAFNSKNERLLAELVSEDCTALGKSGKILMPALKGLFAALPNDTITQMELKDCQVLDDGSERLTYAITYSSKGLKEGVFAFNKEGKISQIDYIAAAKAQTVSGFDVPAPTVPLISLPFILGDNNLIIFEGKLNGIPKKFIFDSGAKRSIVNSARITGNKEKGTAAIGGVNNATAQNISVADSISVDISGLKVENVSLVSKDLSHLEPSGVEIAALIGMDIMGAYDILFDYNKKMLTLISPKAKIQFQSGNVTSIPYAQFSKGYLPCVKVNISGHDLVLGIDCGATANLLSSRYDSLLDDVAEIGLVGVSENATQNKMGNAAVTIGEIDLGKQPFVLQDISHLGLEVDGLLGYPTLKARKMLLKNSTRELLIF